MIKKKNKMIDPKFDSKELKKRLTKTQYEVLVNEATEPPFTGEYIVNNHKGIYVCPICGTELFGSETKFESGSGWPSFYDVANNKAVKLADDYSYGMHRVKVMCATCGAHLGHVFSGPANVPTGMMYCINSAALKFKPQK